MVSQTWVFAKKGHNFLFDHWTALKFLHEILEAIILGVSMQSLLGDEEELSGKTRVMAHKGHNFWSDRWVVQKCLQEFPHTIFLRVAMELLLGDE